MVILANVAHVEDFFVVFLEEAELGGGYIGLMKV
jgi:hypothetical protein